MDEGAEEGRDLSTTSSGTATFAVVPTPIVEAEPIVSFIRRTSCAGG
jgi:hypothetical protein